jgi:hypothetical protein
MHDHELKTVKIDIIWACILQINSDTLTINIIVQTMISHVNFTPVIIHVH